MKILVTGGSGFIGQHLTKKLIEDEHEVTITSNGSEPQIAGVKKVLYTGLSGIDWDYIQNNPFDVVFHQAANNDTRCTDRKEIWRANVNAPMELFMKTNMCGCKRFIYASSTAVYGNSHTPFTEEIIPDPLNIYAESKVAFDKFAMDFSVVAKVNVTGLRYCNVYGPGEELKGKRMSMIGQIIREADNLYGRVKLFEHGEQKRDWVYINDVVQANILAMNRTDPNGKIYNIGSGKATSFNDIINILNDIYEFKIEQTNRRLEYIPCPFVKEFQTNTECNIEKARNELGFNPEFNIENGIIAYLKGMQ